jgi:hypothetical protein
MRTLNLERRCGWVGGKTLRVDGSALPLAFDEVHCAVMDRYEFGLPLEEVDGIRKRVGRIFQTRTWIRGTLLRLRGEGEEREKRKDEG